MGCAHSEDVSSAKPTSDEDPFEGSDRRFATPRSGQLSRKAHAVSPAPPSVRSEHSSAFVAVDSRSYGSSSGAHSHVSGEGVPLSSDKRKRTWRKLYDVDGRFGALDRTSDTMDNDRALRLHETVHSGTTWSLRETQADDDVDDDVAVGIYDEECDELWMPAAPVLSGLRAPSTASPLPGAVPHDAGSGSGS